MGLKNALESFYEIKKKAGEIFMRSFYYSYIPIVLYLGDLYKYL